MRNKKTAKRIRGRCKHIDIFNVEESNLISIYEGESRTEVIQDIKAAKKYLEDDELLKLSEKVVGKLEAVTDGKFAGMKFTAEE